MTTHLEILRAGIHTTIQDRGRPGYRALGVPASGALDAETLELVNALLGNPGNTGALELLYGGIAVRARNGALRFALGCATGRIERPDGSQHDVPAWHTAVLGDDETLTIDAPGRTAAAYLAVAGGFAIAPVLGSMSTYVAGSLGGWQGRPLQRGDRLPLAATNVARAGERMLTREHVPAAPSQLRVIAGPQHTRFRGDALDALIATPYRVTPSSNRTGLRLDGALLQHDEGHDLLSEGVATGSLQVPGTGLPVLLLADHPTVGGYPKIATVISADLAAAGRLRIGSDVRFTLVDAAAARAARIEADAARDARLAAIRNAG